MNKYCGMLKRVGSLGGGGVVTSGGAVGNVRVASEITVIEIGDTLLRNVRCTDDLFDLLDPGQEACLFVFRHFFWKPVLLGVKYDDGRKYSITFGQTVATILQYLLMWPILIVATGFMIGLMGGKEGGFLASLSVVWILGGILLTWLNALFLLLGYLRIKMS